MKKANALTVLKVFLAVVVLLTALAVYLHPFAGVCFGCSLLYRFSVLLFKIFGLTAFLLPPVLALCFFLKNEKVKKILKYSLWLWLPVLLNLALVRDVLEIKANIGGFAGGIFSAAHDHRIDFIFLFIPILVLDLVVLYFLGVDVPGMFKKIWGESKGIVPGTDKKATEDTEGSERCNNENQ